MTLLSALYTVRGGDGNTWLYCSLDSLLPRIEGLLDRQLQRLGIRVLKLVCRILELTLSLCLLMLDKTAKWEVCLPARQFFMWRLLNT